FTKKAFYRQEIGFSFILRYFFNKERIVRQKDKRQLFLMRFPDSSPVRYKNVASDFPATSRLFFCHF
ncbi:TPA: hypothetical protein ACNHSL_002945, partial [Enterococcus faecalis]